MHGHLGSGGRAGAGANFFSDFFTHLCNQEGVCSYLSQRNEQQIGERL